MTILLGFSSAISCVCLLPYKIFMVEMTGLEPAASRSQNARSPKLNYISLLPTAGTWAKVLYDLRYDSQKTHLMEPIAGIEPVLPAWRAGALPLNYIGVYRIAHTLAHYLAAQTQYTIPIKYVSYPLVDLVGLEPTTDRL